MSTGTQKEMSHADRHDLDKLARWRTGLIEFGEPGAAAFPVCAIFLVSPEDRASHDVFRRYRSDFEDLGGSFHNLVIFGQHGISTTQVAFLRELGQRQDAVPLLVLAPMHQDNPAVFCVALPSGEQEGELDDTQTWGVALDAIRRAVSGTGPASLDGIKGVEALSFLRGSLMEAVVGVSEDLSEKV